MCVPHLNRSSCVCDPPVFELATGLKGHLALLRAHSQARTGFIKADGNDMMTLHLACWFCKMQARQVLWTSVRNYTSIPTASAQQQAESMKSLTSLVLSLYVVSSVSS